MKVNNAYDEGTPQQSSLLINPHPRKHAGLVARTHLECIFLRFLQVRSNRQQKLDKVQ